MKRFVVKNQIRENDTIIATIVTAAKYNLSRVDRDNFFAMSYCYSPQPD